MRAFRLKSANLRARFRARWRPAILVAARAVLEAAGLDPDYVEVADFDGPTLLVAARVGSTRLIDNAPLPKGDRP